MNKMVFEKRETDALAQFLEELELKNKLSRLRNKLIKKLNEITLELEEERVVLAKEYSIKDEKGEALVEDGQFQLLEDKKDEFSKELKSLVNEKNSIEIGEYSNNFKPLFDFLDSDAFDVLLSGVNATRYDRLLEIWEESQKEETVSPDETNKEVE